MKGFKEFIIERDIDFDGGIVVLPYNSISDKVKNIKNKKNIDKVITKYNKGINNKGDSISYTIDEYEVGYFLKGEYNDKESVNKFSKKSLTIKLKDVNMYTMKSFSKLLKKELGIDNEILIKHNTMRTHRYI